MGRHRPQVRPRLRSDRFARIDLFSWQRSNELQFFDGTDPEDRQGFRTILVGPAHPGADGIHTVAAQGLGYTDAFTIAARNTLRNLSAGKVLSGPTFVDGLRVAEVTDAVIAAVASGVERGRHPPRDLKSGSSAGDTDAAQVSRGWPSHPRAQSSSSGSHGPARSCPSRSNPPSSSVANAAKSTMPWPTGQNTPSEMASKNATPSLSTF